MIQTPSNSNSISSNDIITTTGATTPTETPVTQAALDAVIKRLDQMSSLRTVRGENIHQWAPAVLGISGEAMIKLLKKYKKFYTNYSGTYVAQPSDMQEAYFKSLADREKTQQRRREAALSKYNKKPNQNQVVSTGTTSANPAASAAALDAKYGTGAISAGGGESTPPAA